MDQLETGSFLSPTSASARPGVIRIVTWNINRGQQLDGVIEFLQGAAAELILLQEADVNVRRTQYRNTSREIAQATAALPQF